MSRAQDAIADSLHISLEVFQNFVADLTPREYLYRPVPKANCAAWIVGHLVLTDRGALKLLESAEPPLLPKDFEQRFARTAEAAGADDFGDVSLLMPLLHQHRRLLIDAVRSATDELLARPLEPPHSLFRTVAGRLSFVALHTLMHGGQITIIRRSLGRPPLV